MRDDDDPVVIGDDEVAGPDRGAGATMGSPSETARIRPIGCAGERTVQNAGVRWIVHS